MWCLNKMLKIIILRANFCKSIAIYLTTCIFNFISKNKFSKQMSNCCWVNKKKKNLFKILTNEMITVIE